MGGGERREKEEEEGGGRRGGGGGEERRGEERSCSPLFQELRRKILSFVSNEMCLSLTLN